jgi:hypothetical protein
VAVAHLVSRFAGEPDFKLASSFAPKGNFGAIHLEDSGVPARGTQPGRDTSTGQKAELHEAAGIFSGKFNPIKDSCVSPAEVNECGGRRRLLVVATELQHRFSMRQLRALVNGFGTLARHL